MIGRAQPLPLGWLTTVPGRCPHLPADRVPGGPPACRWGIDRSDGKNVETVRSGLVSTYKTVAQKVHMIDSCQQRLMRFEKKRDWKNAAAANRTFIAQYPESHWFLTKQSEYYYELKQYGRALKHARKALQLAPHCPLVLWDYAGALHMLDQTEQARLVYRRLLRRGVEHIAYGQCGEGYRWAENLLCDCLYKIGTGYADEGKTRLAIRYLRRHLVSRRPGLRSLFPAKNVRRKLADLEKKTE